LSVVFVFTQYMGEKMAILTRFVRDDVGPNALEYRLIVGLVLLAVVTGATAAGGALGDLFTAPDTERGTLLDHHHGIKEFLSPCPKGLPI
jgi:pilus assembly protein Flp/PilA